MKFENKKAATNKGKVKLFKQFLESIFTVEPEHTISDQERILIVNRDKLLNDKDFKTTDVNENHKNIEKEELENIIKKLDIKKTCGEDKITSKMIKLTFNGTRKFLLNKISINPTV